MTAIDLHATASALGRAIGAGDLDPVALTDAYLDAIAAHPARDRIFTVVTAERARASARAASKRARLGVRRSLFDGIPIAWKDLISVSGTPTRGGSTLTDLTPATTDAPIVARGEAAGLVTLGKTHQTELAFSGLGVNPVTATPPNRHGDQLAPGGSSSGAAASVAFGLTAIAMGSDTGGSIRLPSAWNDLVGYKPTFGTLPIDGCLPLAPDFDTLGPLARNVEDASMLTALLLGETAPDLRGAPLKGRRIGVLTGLPFEDMEDAPGVAFAAGLGRLVAAGATVEDVSTPEVAEVLALAPTLYGAETWGTWGKTIETNPDAMHPPVLARFRSGREVLGADFMAAEATLARARADYVRATQLFDAIALPSSALLPPEVPALLADDALFAEKNLLTLRNTRIGNLLGLTAISLPTGTPSCGLMLMAPRGDDRRLLRLAHAAELALA